MAFSATHYLCFFDMERSLASVWSSTLVTVIRILSPLLTNAMLVSMETTVGISSNPAREKSVTDSPSNLLLMNA